jgi:hypothetical protein
MRTVIAVLFATLFSSTLPLLTSAQTAPSAALVSVLQRMRTVDVSYIIGWSADPRAPRDAQGAVNQVKTAILALDASDRDAMFFWLRSHGRDALHQRGVTDAEIGPPLYPIDYKIAWVALPEGFVNPTPIPTPTPEPPPTPTPHPKSAGAWAFLIPLALQAIITIPTYSAIFSDFQNGALLFDVNKLQKWVTPSGFLSTAQSIADAHAVAGMLANAALKEHPTSTPVEHEVASIPAAQHWTLLEIGRQRWDLQAAGIVVDKGVAGVRNYSEGAACLGFTNHNAKAVREIDFDFTLVDAHDRSLQSIGLHRAGTFAQNERSEAPHDLAPSDVAREDANCVTIGSSAAGAPTIPSLSRAVAMAYEVRRVVFDDGTVWLRPGANLWPHEKV